MTQASLAFARLSPKVDFGAPDGPADLVFLIAAPGARRRRPPHPADRAGPRAGAAGVRRLAAGRDLRRGDRPPGRRGRLPGARARGRARRRAAPAAAAAPATEAARRSVVVVSACPTGIAHTYMAADKLTAAGEGRRGRRARRDAGLLRRHAARPGGHPRRRRGHLRRRRRACGTRTASPASRSCSSGTKRAINEPDVMIREALAAADDPNGRRVRRHRGRAAPARCGTVAGGAPAPARRSAAGCSPA